MLRLAGMCCPNGLFFHQKYVHKGFGLVKNKSLEEGQILPKLQKKKKKPKQKTKQNYNQLFLSQKNPLEMGPDLRKFQKKKIKPHQISHF